MKFTLSYDLPIDEEVKGPIKIGWFLASNSIPPVILDPPRRVKLRETQRGHSKSASRCPAILNLESRYFEILCPIDLNLEFTRDKDNRPGFRDLNGESSGTRRKHLSSMISVTNEREWRYPDRPTFQLKLPYTLIADEPVYVSQIAPFMHYANPPWPGTIFGGRFPVDVWPRPLMFAFEWHDIKKPLTIRRGDPLFYMHFDTRNPVRPIQLVEAEITDDLQKYLAQISGVVNYVDQTFSLFEAAERSRPEKLLTEVNRKSRIRN